MSSFKHVKKKKTMAEIIDQSEDNTVNIEPDVLPRSGSFIANNNIFGESNS